MSIFRYLLSVSYLFAVLILSDLALASVSTSTLERCYTKLGTSSMRSVSRFTFAVTVKKSRTATITSTPSTTTTPATSTVTSTAIATTTSTTTVSQTSTLSTTSTYMETTTVTAETVTITSTTATTNTITETPGISTTTISASTDFTPLASAIALQGPNTPNQRRDAVKHARLLNPVAKPAAFTLGIKNGVPTVWPQVYPSKVSCFDFIEVISTSTLTRTATSTRTITAMTPVSTITTTSTITSIVTTQLVAAPVTLSFSTTITVTSTVKPTTTITSSTTTTATETAAAPTATSYAACGSDNLVGTVNGTGIDKGFYYTTNPAPDVASAQSAADCCVQGITKTQTNGVPYGATFYLGGTCYLLPTSQTDQTCKFANEVGYFVTNSGLQPDTGYIVSNGNCGHVVYSGDDG